MSVSAVQLTDGVNVVSLSRAAGREEATCWVSCRRGQRSQLRVELRESGLNSRMICVVMFICIKCGAEASVSEGLCNSGQDVRTSKPPADVRLLFWCFSCVQMV